MKKFTRDLSLTILVWGSIIYCSSKPTIDIMLGKDSLWSRYINRPLINYLTEGSLKTEEQFDNYLEYNRQQIKRKGLASFLNTLP